MDVTGGVMIFVEKIKSIDIHFETAPLFTSHFITVRKVNSPPDTQLRTHVERLLDQDQLVTSCLIAEVDLSSLDD